MDKTLKFTKTVKFHILEGTAKKFFGAHAPTSSPKHWTKSPPMIRMLLLIEQLKLMTFPSLFRIPLSR